MMSNFLTFTLLLNIATTAVVAVDFDFDWEQAVLQLRQQKKDWQSHGIVDYAYNYSVSCFCTPCSITPKYLTVETKLTTKTTLYGEDKLRRRPRVVNATFLPHDYPWVCDDAVDHPPLENYLTVDGLFNEAIDHAKEGRESNCSEPEPLDSNSQVLILPPPICGGSVEIVVDPVLKYPLYLSLAYGPFLADAGMTYNIGCLDVMSVLDGDVNIPGYSNTCDFEGSNPEDS